MRKISQAVNLNAWPTTFSWAGTAIGLPFNLSAAQILPMISD
jgi:hypothetical protein